MEAVEPYYPQPSGAVLQHWFRLSDPGVEEALYDSRAMREFVGVATAANVHDSQKLGELLHGGRLGVWGSGQGDPGAGAEGSGLYPSEGTTESTFDGRGA